MHATTILLPVLKGADHSDEKNAAYNRYAFSVTPRIGTTRLRVISNCPGKMRRK
jgi:hypothetical protein